MLELRLAWFRTLMHRAIGVSAKPPPNWIYYDAYGNLYRGDGIGLKRLPPGGCMAAKVAGGRGIVYECELCARAWVPGPGQAPACAMSTEEIQVVRGTG